MGCKELLTAAHSLFLSLLWPLRQVSKAQEYSLAHFLGRGARKVCHHWATWVPPGHSGVSIQIPVLPIPAHP